MPTDSMRTEVAQAMGQPPSQSPLTCANFKDTGDTRVDGWPVTFGEVVPTERRGDGRGLVTCGTSFLLSKVPPSGPGLVTHNTDLGCVSRTLRESSPDGREKSKARLSTPAWSSGYQPFISPRVGESRRHWARGWRSGKEGLCTGQPSRLRAAWAGGSGGLGTGASSEGQRRPSLHWCGEEWSCSQMATPSWPWALETRNQSGSLPISQFCGNLRPTQDSC